MSLCISGFDKGVTAQVVPLTIQAIHPFIKLAQALPWDTLLSLIVPDLQKTEKLNWWRGRPLRIRIHLGIFLLQKMFDLTDRQAEYMLKDNAAFQLFCGYGLVEKWHCPDHTKIEEFRSRLLPETQRQLTNLMAQQAVKLNYANPAKLDIDSTVQEANIAFPASCNLLLKIAGVAKRLVAPLNEITNRVNNFYEVNLRRIKAVAMNYFMLRSKKTSAACLPTLQILWREVYENVLPILKDAYLLIKFVQLPKYWAIRQALEKLQWRGALLLEQLYSKCFENQISEQPIYSLHAYSVEYFNKNKLSGKVEFGRAYQLGRIEGNFLIVGHCDSLRMPDAQSLPGMVRLHETLFGKKVVDSLATDKGYYAYDNERLLEKKGITEIGLPRPNRTLNAPRSKMSFEVMEKLHNRRAGIEPLIGHCKHGGQLGKSRMKSDNGTLAAGYASVLGFNLRQLKRAILGKICLNSANDDKNAQSPAENGLIAA